MLGSRVRAPEGVQSKRLIINDYRAFLHLGHKVRAAVPLPHGVQPLWPARSQPLWRQRGIPTSHFRCRTAPRRRLRTQWHSSPCEAWAGSRSARLRIYFRGSAGTPEPALGSARAPATRRPRRDGQSLRSVDDHEPVGLAACPEREVEVVVITPRADVATLRR